MNAAPETAPDTAHAGATAAGTARHASLATPAAVRPSAAFMRQHPAHWLALGLGSGLSPKAPGTVGTLWAWLSFLLLDRWLTPSWGDRGWAGLLLLSLAVGLWACTVTAQHLRTADPGAIVWDEVLAFWLVLWLVGGGWWTQLLAFV